MQKLENLKCLNLFFWVSKHLNKKSFWYKKHNETAVCVRNKRKNTRRKTKKRRTINHTKRTSVKFQNNQKEWIFWKWWKKSNDSIRVWCMMTRFGCIDRMREFNTKSFQTIRCLQQLKKRTFLLIVYDWPRFSPRNHKWQSIPRITKISDWYL